MFMSVEAEILEIIMQALDDSLANLRKSDFHHWVTSEEQSLLGSAAVQMVKHLYKHIGHMSSKIQGFGTRWEMI